MKNHIKILESSLTLPGMSLPIKSTLIASDDRILLISPLPDLDKFKDEIQSFGTPTDIIAPNSFHHLGLKPAINMFPSAKLWGEDAVRKKRSDLPWESNSPSKSNFGNEIKIFHLNGMPKIDEIVIYHAPSKSLIVADLCFNHVEGKGFGNWLIFNLFGTYKRFAVSKFYQLFIKDKKKFRDSVQQILDLDIKTIIVPHGLNIEEKGNEKLKNALKERRLI